MALREVEFTSPEPRRPVGIVVFDQEREKVLLVQHGPKAQRKEGTLGVPAGRPKGDETQEQAAIREFYEETGLVTSIDNLIKLSSSPYLGVNSRETGPKKYSIDVFVATIYQGELQKTDKSKPWEARPIWARIDTLARRRRMLMPSVIKIVNDGLDTIK